MEQNKDGELELLRNRLDRAKLVLAVTKVVHKFISKIESERPLDKTGNLCMIETSFRVMNHIGMAEAIFPSDQCVELQDHIKQEITSHLSHSNAEMEKLKNEMHEGLQFERDLYAEMVEQEPQFKDYWNRFVLETWYFTTEEEAYQHIKFDEYLKTCDAIKVDSTLDVLSKLDLSEFKDLPEALIKGGVLRRICRLKKFAEDDQMIEFVEDLVNTILFDKKQKYGEIVKGLKEDLSSKDYDTVAAHFVGQVVSQNEDIFDDLARIPERHGLRITSLHEGFKVCREVLRGHPHLPGEDNPSVSHDVVREAIRKYFDLKRKELEEWWVKAAMRRFPYLKAYKRLRQENSTVGGTCTST